MATQEAPALVERWFSDLFVDRALDKADDLVDPDFEAYDPAGKSVVAGLAQFKEWLTWYRGAFSGSDWRLHDLIQSGDKIVVRYSGEVTYHGGFRGIPTRHQRVTEMGILIFEIAGGKIRRLWSAMSDLGLTP